MELIILFKILNLSGVKMYFVYILIQHDCDSLGILIQVTFANKIILTFISFLCVNLLINGKQNYVDYIQ